MVVRVQGQELRLAENVAQGQSLCMDGKTQINLEVISKFALEEEANHFDLRK